MLTCTVGFLANLAVDWLCPTIGWLDRCKAAAIDCNRFSVLRSGLIPENINDSWQCCYRRLQTPYALHTLQPFNRACWQWSYLLMELPNDACTTFSQNWISCSTIGEEYCRLIGWRFKIMKRQLWTSTIANDVTIINTP